MSYTWLNQHYRPAVELARLILRGSSWDLRHGAARASSFFLDMSRVFEEFVYVALREAWADSEGELRRGDRTFRLDDAGAVVLKPDLTWWVAGRCRFVGDVKYKRIAVSGIVHADLYQLLAYTLATGLPRGTLIYAHGFDGRVRHEIPTVGKVLEVEPIRLDGEPEQILAEITRIASGVLDHGSDRSAALSGSFAGLV